MKTDPALRDLWLKHGCPKKMVIHVGSEVYYLDEGEQTPDFLANPPNWANQAKGVNNLQVHSGVTDSLVPVTRNCEHCHKPFVPKRDTERFDSPRCRVAAYRKRKGEEIYARLGVRI